MIRIQKVILKRALLVILPLIILGLGYSVYNYPNSPLGQVLGTKTKVDTKLIKAINDLPDINLTPTKAPVIDCYFNNGKSHTFVTESECYEYYEDGTVVTPTPEPVQAVQTYRQPTVPPLIDCVLYTGRHIQADKMTCDDFTTRRYDPYETQKKSNNSGSTQQQYVPKYFPPCTVYYSKWGFSQTYTYMTPEECQRTQDDAKSDNSVAPSNPTPTLTDEQKQQFIDDTNSQVDAHNKQVNDCRNSVNNDYDAKVQGCYNQYGGGSSAGPACAQIANSGRQSALDSCGSTI